jgi:hypothetical protein
MIVICIIAGITICSIAYRTSQASIAASESKVKVAELQTQAAREQAAADIARAGAETMKIEEMRLQRL